MPSLLELWALALNFTLVILWLLPCIRMIRRYLFGTVEVISKGSWQEAACPARSALSESWWKRRWILFLNFKDRISSHDWKLGLMMLRRCSWWWGFARVEKNSRKQIHTPHTDLPRDGFSFQGRQSTATYSAFAFEQSSVHLGQVWTVVSEWMSLQIFVG